MQNESKTNELTTQVNKVKLEFLFYNLLMNNNGADELWVNNEMQIVNLGLFI